MRVTNQIITNKTLTNINNNKQRLVDIENQYQTGKKISRPSDDPVIAIRALKLRNNLSEVNQYYQKNAPDAKNWMSNTESTLNAGIDMLRVIHENLNAGATDTFTVNDRETIYNTCKQYRDEFYTEGNASYAGRYLFTGYKTQTSLTYLEDDNSKRYTITENFDKDDIKLLTVTKGGYLNTDINREKDVTTGDDAPSIAENNKVYILNLAYKNIDADSFTTNTKIKIGNTDYTVNTKISTATDAYKVGDNEVNFLSDTGEMVIGNIIAKDVINNKIEFSITYDKSRFQKNDIRPVHYFDCIETPLKADADGTMIEDKKGKKIKYTKEDQQIEYEITYNQKLTVNVQASSCLTPDLGRELDGIISSIDDVKAVESKISEVQKVIDSTSADTEIEADKKEEYLANLNKMKDQLETEKALKEKVMHERFSYGLDNVKAISDQCNITLSDLGAREKRLELTTSRLQSQQTETKDLLSNNEDADLTETIINFTTMKNVYTASLNAGARSIQNTLLDFIS